MKAHSPLLFCSLVIIVVGLFGSPGSVVADPFHPSCNICHVEKAPGIDNAVLGEQLPDLCVSCHAERLTRGEHVVGVEVTTGMTRDLPLNDGRLGCTTCHDPHGESTGQLRRPRVQLCPACHKL